MKQLAAVKPEDILQHRNKQRTTGYLDQNGIQRLFSIEEEAEEVVLRCDTQKYFDS